MAAQRTLPAKQITLNMALAVDSISFDAVRVALNLVANMRRLEMTARFFIQRLEQSGISEQRRQPVSKINYQALRIALDGIERSDAMLHGAEPVSQTYKLNQLSGNSPATPDGWISCSERMPEELDDVLVTDGEHVEVKWWNGHIWDCWAPRNSDISYKDVTHWMPLPEPPQEVK